MTLQVALRGSTHVLIFEAAFGLLTIKTAASQLLVSGRSPATLYELFVGCWRLAIPSLALVRRSYRDTRAVSGIWLVQLGWVLLALFKGWHGPEIGSRAFGGGSLPFPLMCFELYDQVRQEWDDECRWECRREQTSLHLQQMVARGGGSRLQICLSPPSLAQATLTTFLPPWLALAASHALMVGTWLLFRRSLLALNSNGGNRQYWVTGPVGFLWHYISHALVPHSLLWWDHARAHRRGRGSAQPMQAQAQAASNVGGCKVAKAGDGLVGKGTNSGFPPLPGVTACPKPSMPGPNRYLGRGDTAGTPVAEAAAACGAVGPERGQGRDVSAQRWWQSWVAPKRMTGAPAPVAAAAAAAAATSLMGGARRSSRRHTGHGQAAERGLPPPPPPLYVSPLLPAVTVRALKSSSEPNIPLKGGG
jgi:hypothetical protein